MVYVIALSLIIFSPNKLTIKYVSEISGWPLSMPVYVCEAAVAEELVVVVDVSLIVMAEVPRAVAGKSFSPHIKHWKARSTSLMMADKFYPMSLKRRRNTFTWIILQVQCVNNTVAWWKVSY